MDLLSNITGGTFNEETPINNIIRLPISLDLRCKQEIIKVKTHKFKIKITKKEKYNLKLKKEIKEKLKLISADSMLNVERR